MSLLTDAYLACLAQARQARAAGEIDQAFAALERAHVLGQRRFTQHLHVHWLMLLLAASQYDSREIRGQLLRLALTPLGHLTGRLPLGNTGRANVSAFAPMQVDEATQRVLRGE